MFQPGVTHHEWRELSENAQLVIEENQLLTKQVQVLKDKQAEMAAQHHQRGGKGRRGVYCSGSDSLTSVVYGVRSGTCNELFSDCLIFLSS